MSIPSKMYLRAVKNLKLLDTSNDLALFIASIISFVLTSAHSDGVFFNCSYGIYKTLPFIFSTPNQYSSVI